MLLPKDILSGLYRAPDVFLCETNKDKITKLDPIGLSGVFKFNAYSELTFDVARVYNDMLTGTTHVNPFYNKIEALRLVYLPGFGYFELQDPEIDSDGIKEIKSLTAYSLEYTMSQKYLELFKVNMGTVDSVEVIYMEEQKKTNPDATLIPVTLYNPNIKELSLLDLILEKVYGWQIGHVDASLQTMSRQFDIDRESVYDFIMNEICEKFNCYAIFDTENNTINLYAETSVNKFTGDGVARKFTIYPAFEELDTVSIDGYKTTNYIYNNITGELELLGDIPPMGAIIEVTDKSLSKWETDVYVTFDNLAQQMNVSYSSDDIKTVLTVKGSDDLDIREVNNGLPYIVDLSYFYSKEWMGEDLYNAYTNYLEKCTEFQAEYKVNSQQIIELSNRILYETNRLSLQYSEASVDSQTVGTYYVRGGDAAAGYYYTEVSLPAEYIAGTTYYSTKTTDLDESKVAALYEALKTYYSTGKTTDFTKEDSTLSNDFAFMDEEFCDKEESMHTHSAMCYEDGELVCGIEPHTHDDTCKYNYWQYLVYALSSEDFTDQQKDDAVLKFLSKMWEQLGLVPLKTLYLAPYKEVQTTNVSAGWSEQNNENYGQYYPVVLMIQSLETAIKLRQATIDGLTKTLNEYGVKNAEISESLLIDNNFTDDQMVRLSAFLREDEYTDDNFVVTGNESTEELFKLKQELLECGRIELSKLCEPCLKFSMSLANIYALPEFEPIVHQFQLGNLIKVALRPDYIKHTRLMEVNINFDNFSDFSCTFGDLASTRSQSDLHADLLSQAVSAGKTVASNASYWSKGTDTATAMDIRLQQGLLNAATEIKAIDGKQNAFIDKYGIHLQEVDTSTGEVSPEQGWIVNNKFLYSDDAFKTTKSVFGKFKVPMGTTTDGDTVYEERWGLLSDAVVAGYIEGSTINGGTIQIGERADGQYNFAVDEDGYITMAGGKGISSTGTAVDLDDYNTTIEIVADKTVLTSSEQMITLTCKVYSYDIDVTNRYNASAFYWKRSTGDEIADNAWNDEQAVIANGNILDVTLNDVYDTAVFWCEVNLKKGSSKCSNSIVVTTDNSNVNIFTSKPDSMLKDGYYYHAGDMWIVGSDYQPPCYECGKTEQEGHTHDNSCWKKRYSQNTILICTANQTAQYSDSDWIESVYCSKTFEDLHAWQDDMQEHVQILDDGLHLIGTVQDGVSFESVLQSKQLTFRSNQGGTATDVVWLGVDDMTARDTTIIGHLNVAKEHKDDKHSVYINLGGYRQENEDGSYKIVGGFIFQVEDNGSLSIM